MSKRSRKLDTARMEFHIYQDVQLAAGVAYLTLSPNGMGGRSVTEADAWSLFRVESFKFRLHCLPTGSVNDMYAGYYANIADTPPATAATVMELISSTLIPFGQTVPTDWVKLGADEIRGAFNWYKTVPGSTDPSEEQPGSFAFFSVTAAAIARFEAYFVLTFKDQIAIGNTPIERELRKRIRDERKANLTRVARERVLTVLSTPTVQ